MRLNWMCDKLLEYESVYFYFVIFAFLITQMDQWKQNISFYKNNMWDIGP